jgi:hypothetical protein
MTSFGSLPSSILSTCCCVFLHIFNNPVSHACVNWRRMRSSFEEYVPNFGKRCRVVLEWLEQPVDSVFRGVVVKYICN